jgi:hypothetical protein
VLREFTIHPQWSVFATFPVLILALVGWRHYVREHMAEAVFVLAVTLGMFDIVAPLPFWRGEVAYGPRYLLYLLPVLSLPALYVLDWLAAPAPAQHSRPKPLTSKEGDAGTGQESQARSPAYYARLGLLGCVIIAALVLAVAQFQVQRFGFYDWRGSFRDPVAARGESNDYFDYTPVPKICWDHYRCRDRLEDLPYYGAFARGKTPEEIDAWKRELLSHINYSNLYWFPDLNR